jgi:hypothetical protein
MVRALLSPIDELEANGPGRSAHRPQTAPNSLLPTTVDEMTDQIKAVQYLDRKTVVLHLRNGGTTEPVRILHVDSVGLYVGYQIDDIKGPQAFYPWSSIDHADIVLG